MRGAWKGAYALGVFFLVFTLMKELPRTVPILLLIYVYRHFCLHVYLSVEHLAVMQVVPQRPSHHDVLKFPESVSQGEPVLPLGVSVGYLVGHGVK